MAAKDGRKGGDAVPPNYLNRTLFHRDNLDVLRGMNSGTVDLIATDPPFNKGRDFHATPDSLASGASFQDRWSWEEDVHEEWTDQIKDDWPAVWATLDAAKGTYGLDMAAYLCFMGVRIIEMHRVLKDTGSIYLHCDHTASHYLKLMLDAVFGRKNFRNEIVWHYRTYQGQVKNYYPKKHDIIFWYGMPRHKGLDELEYLNNYRETVDYERWKKFLVNGNEIRGNNYPASDSRFMSYYNRWVSEHGKKPGAKDVIHKIAGYVVDDVWTDIKAVDPKDKEERVGYPTQKPLSLYERIIKASSKEGDMVLDPFCGCASSLVAAEGLGRQWAGIDIWDKAHETVWNRFLKVGLAVKGSRKKGQGNLGEKDILYTTEVPKRTDEEDEAAAKAGNIETASCLPGGRAQRRRKITGNAFA